jgi:demethylmenaquinone methyltransferase/2-methoxy-6-polyprenyl-1,4-benzoquinol methylase
MIALMDKLADYYAKRAAEYERIYAKPERQADLVALRPRIGKLAAGKKVLELACGTGYWTEIMAAGAAHVTAIDVNEEVLQIARTKSCPKGRVDFVAGDCYAPPIADRSHNALFAGFWWSHVPLAKLDAFLDGILSSIAPGGFIAFLDNRYVEGSSTPVSRRDADGNSYQLRKLDDGSTHEVLKNFPSASELIQRASRFGWGANVDLLQHYWLLTYWAPK